ncbi:DUF481 domain-containing protein [Reichenbachiella ulvae]|uniref:DUF481 domain-containing protein n=1 Tax=Reichenbachiella ulvae TaxID=2980104 RepID=A0ABT3CQQ6_9BACT|nr:DUF481 domain-containing protein [Reichenbachiella ulvae]MCV9385809.1 DUF481 domain-containing protein [Reichenbachiella ulvae]
MRTFIPILFLLFLCNNLLAQNPDTVFLSNTHVVIGEIQSMEYGVLTIETEYSEDDFTIDWEEVIGVNSSSEFIIMLRNKYRLKASLSMDAINPDYMIISSIEGARMFAQFKDIVYLKSSEDRFWDKLSFDIDGGYSFTRASNTTQFSVNGKANYTDTHFFINTYSSVIYNKVSEDTTTISTSRNNYGFTAQFFLKGSWFIIGNNDILQSEQQNLRLRTTGQIGLGKMLIRNNKVFVGVATGLASNTERFYNTDDKDQSYESLLQANINAYGYKDLRFSAQAQVYPSITVKKRIRANYTATLKYDLPLDFYIGLNTTLNYDNQPTEDATNFDFVFQSNVGWSF